VLAGILIVAFGSVPASAYSPCDVTGGLVVTYLSVTPSFVNIGDKVTIDFRVAALTPSGNRGECVSACAHAGNACRASAQTKAERDACQAAEAGCKDGCGQPYTPPQSAHVSGIGQASFLLSSSDTQRTKEFANTPVFPGSADDEYRAVIQIAQDSPTGSVWVYVKAESLQGSVYGRPVSGPPINTSSEQTDDTSGTSRVQVETSTIASPALFSTGVELTLIAPALFATLAVLGYIVICRTRKPASNR